LIKLGQHAEEIEKMDVKSTLNILKINGESLKQRIKDLLLERYISMKTFIPKI
jgi:uncharacterized protein YaaN involved in tellurite resistance